jgi:hypothetical protein
MSCVFPLAFDAMREGVLAVDFADDAIMFLRAVGSPALENN